MAGIYGVTRDNLQRITGILPNDISGVRLDEMILEAEAEAERVTNTVFLPKERIDYFDAQYNRVGTWSNMIFVQKKPITQLREILIGINEDDPTGATSVLPKNVRIYDQSGKLLLGPDAEETRFRSARGQNIAIRYTYARMDETATETNLNGATVESDDTALVVDDATGIAIGDFIKIESMDGRHETVKVKTISPITADTKFPHLDNSRVVKMEVPLLAKKLVEVLGGIMVALHMVGNTYTFNTSYSIGEKSVTKGVPYPHFEKVINRLTEERDELIKKLKIPIVI